MACIEYIFLFAEYKVEIKSEDDIEHYFDDSLMCFPQSTRTVSDVHA